MAKAVDGASWMVVEQVVTTALKLATLPVLESEQARECAGRDQLLVNLSSMAVSRSTPRSRAGGNNPAGLL